jgi:hypothetical protein
MEIFGFFVRRLLILPEQCITADEEVKFSAKEAVQRVLRRAHDWFPANIETGVNENGAASQFLKSRKESVKPRVSVGLYGLNSRRIVNVCYSRYGRANNI